MAEKKKAARQGSPLQINTPSNSTSTESQYARLLAYWQTHDGGLNRYEADRLLNVCHLAARVHVLESKGCCFTTQDETAPDLLGRLHVGIRRYWLQFAPPHLVSSANDGEA